LPDDFDETGLTSARSQVMSIPTIVRSSLVAASIISVSAFAFARQPPALVTAQARAASATCAGNHIGGGAGYRQVFARFGGVSTAAPGTRVAAGGGYRGVLSRFSQTRSTDGVACREPARSPVRSAKRS
jgi:hypothetical protein